MKIEPVYDHLPFKQPQIEQWNDLYDNPEYHIEIKSTGAPEDAFLNPLYDSNASILYADEEQASHIPVKPVDFTPALYDHYQLDQQLQNQTGHQLVTQISGDWTGDTVTDVLETLSDSELEIQSFPYDTDCWLKYNEENRTFEVTGFDDVQLRNEVQNVLEKFEDNDTRNGDNSN